MNELLDNINGYPLDELQRKVVLSDDKHLLVSAGAGSGKSLTIIGKIRYLIEVKKIREDEIICISFTNDSTNSIKSKLKDIYNYDVSCYTFHKLGMDILKNEKYTISSSDTLNYIVDEFFNSVLYYKNNLKRVVKVLSKKRLIINYKKEYNNISRYDIDNLKKLVIKFINLYKANNYLNSDFTLFFDKCSLREKNLLLIIFSIYYMYQKELLSLREVDFSDMISKASLMVLKNGYPKKLKYIIIDEFQDTSRVRFELIKAILDKTGASLLVVGDDFQSIYRFTGCDLNIFLDFDKIFEDAKIMKIENTYRNSQELIDIAGSFVMKNSNQLRKNLKSSKRLNKPLVIVYYSNLIKSFENLILKIYYETKKPILILGRNNLDINKIVDNYIFIKFEDEIIYTKNRNIKLKYLTIHRSKGLEEENVIVLNMIDDKLGFPNKIKDEKILRFVSCKEDNFPFAEERRLFYVAITRTKNKTYLMTKKNKESIFVNEIKHNKNIDILHL